MSGCEGYLYPFPKKIAIVQLSSEDSEEFYGDSGHLFSGDSGNLRRLRTCLETCQQSVETKMFGDSGNFFGHYEHSAVSTPKISHVMCECKGVSHGFVRSS
jgi:hypothetical protein